MMKLKTRDNGWNPYVAGALVGVLAVASVFAAAKLLDKSNYLGASTTFVRAAGFVEKSAAPEHVAANAYFERTKIKVDWQFMLVIGVFIGALVSSLSDGSFKKESVPPIWAERFGTSVWKRAVGAFLGGIIAMMGARMASGCPSGHGMSGMMQLAVSSLVALCFFFGTGVLVAHLIYKRR